MQLVHGIAMAIIGIILYRTRALHHCSSSAELDLQNNIEYGLMTAFGVCILMCIIEIVCIIFCGKSFHDWAYKEVCSEKSNVIQTSQTYPAYNYYYYYYYYYDGDCSKDTKINKADWRRNTI